MGNLKEKRIISAWYSRVGVHKKMCHCSFVLSVRIIIKIPLNNYLQLFKQKIQANSQHNVHQLYFQSKFVYKIFFRILMICYDHRWNTEYCVSTRDFLSTVVQKEIERAAVEDDTVTKERVNITTRPFTVF